MVFDVEIEQTITIMHHLKVVADSEKIIDDSVEEFQGAELNDINHLKFFLENNGIEIKTFNKNDEASVEFETSCIREIDQDGNIVINTVDIDVVEAVRKYFDNEGKNLFDIPETPFNYDSEGNYQIRAIDTDCWITRLKISKCDGNIKVEEVE